MTFNIQNFKNKGLPWGGARPSLFQIVFTAPTGIPELAKGPSTMEELAYQAKGTQLPASTLGVVEAGYFGRKIKLAGDRIFADWSVNIMCDEDMVARSFFEAWSNAINTLESNVREGGIINEAPGGDITQAGYKVDQQIIQYGKDGAVIRAYNMVGAWPVEVGQVTLDWDSQNQVIMFPVRFAYDYWLPMQEANERGGAVSLYANKANTVTFSQF